MLEVLSDKNYQNRGLLKIKNESVMLHLVESVAPIGWV